MKFGNLFKAMALAIAMFGFASMSTPSISSAEDVWCYSDDGMAWYLSSETVKVHDANPSFRGVVKVVGEESGEQINFHLFGFESQNDRIECWTYGRNDGKWEWQKNRSPLIEAIWQAMKPYLKQQGVTGVDHWQY